MAVRSLHGRRKEPYTTTTTATTTTKKGWPPGKQFKPVIDTELQKQRNFRWIEEPFIAEPLRNVLGAGFQGNDWGSTKKVTVAGQKLELHTKSQSYSGVDLQNLSRIGASTENPPLNWSAANGVVTNGGLRGVWPPVLEIGRNRPFSPFFCLFRPFPEGPKSTWKIVKTEEEDLFPQISSDLLKPPSLKPPFAAL